MEAVARSSPDAVIKAHSVRQNVRLLSMGWTSAKRPAAISGTSKGKSRDEERHVDAVGEAAFLGDKGAHPPRDLVEQHRRDGGVESRVGGAPM